MHDDSRSTSTSNVSDRDSARRRTERIFAALITHDRHWWHRFRTQLALLTEHDARQVVLVPADDLVADLRYVACPERGTHRRLAECWMCWSDVQLGHVALADVLVEPPVGSQRPRRRRP